MAKSKMTLREFQVRFHAVVKNLDRAIRAPIAKRQRQMRKELLVEYSQSELGQIIWQWRREAFGKRSRPLIRNLRARWSRSQEAWVGGHDLRGLTSKIEEGGRLKRHVFWGKTHRKPGVIVPRRSALKQVYDKHEPLMLKDVAGALNEFFRKTIVG